MSIEEDCDLIMSGGEFCGNACRSAAMYMQSNFGIENSKININKMKIKAFCNGKKSVISIDKNTLIKEIRELEKGVWLVRQQDMTQIVIKPNSKHFRQSPTKENAIYLKGKFNLNDLAVGVVFFDGKTQIPFIWVKAVDTFFEETACVSGSISSALTTPEKIVKVAQPSGACYVILKTEESISVIGDCFKESRKVVSLFDNCSKIQKKYKKIENGFLCYSDLLMMSEEVNDQTNQESLVDVPRNMTISKKPILVRKGILGRLRAVNAALHKKNKNYQLIVLEGYRSYAEQKKQFDEIFERKKSQQKDVCQVEIYEECHKQIAVPEVSGHPTGGAVDVCILDKRGNQFLDFGTAWKDFGMGKLIYTRSPEIEKTAKKNRKLLNQIMQQQGFYQYPAEWWHFSFGDIEWAIANNKDCALYKMVKF